MARVLDQVVGHSSNKEKLIKAVQAKRLPHCFLFVGPSGVGKKKLALALAQQLVCEKTQEKSTDLACGECGSCLRVANQQSESLYLLEPEGQQIKIDHVRDLIEFISLRAAGRGRLIIIDEAHKLNPQAANALLKSIEEPPANTHFVLITSSASALLPTIRSRSQVMRFGALSEQELRKIIETKDWIYSACGGQVDLAEQLMDLDEFRKDALQIWDYILASTPIRARERLLEIAKDREQALVVVRFWQQVLRDAALVYNQSNKPLIHQDQQDLIQQLSQKIGGELSQVSQEALQLEQDLKANVDRNLSFDRFLIKVQGGSL